MARIFIYDGVEYFDPDPDMKPEEVRQSMANFMPELSNASTNESKRGDDNVYTFSKRVGTKGRPEPIELTQAEAIKELQSIERCFNGEGLAIKTEAQRLRLIAALKVAEAKLGGI